MLGMMACDTMFECMEVLEIMKKHGGGGDPYAKRWGFSDAWHDATKEALLLSAL
jgi:hypothetical protein